MILQEIGLAVQRIQKMEKLYDFLLDSKVINSDQFDSKPGVREAEQILFDYYSNGDWLNDYDLEKKHLLPTDLKRNVLSQDDLFDLLFELNEQHQSK